MQRRNASQLRAVMECRLRLRARRQEAEDARREVEDIARRAGPNATEKERAAARREVRLERLSSKDPASLTREERAELAEGMKAEMAATHAALDRAHARDRGFMRIVHSALACYHRDHKEALENQIASEEALLKLGSGDKLALYALQSELRHTEEILERSREVGRNQRARPRAVRGRLHRAPHALHRRAARVEARGRPLRGRGRGSSTSGSRSRRPAPRRTPSHPRVASISCE